MNKIKLSLIPFFVLILGSFFLPLSTMATEGETPFGGFTVYVFYCNCSHNYLIFHLPAAGPSPIIFDDLSSTLYEYRKIKEAGNWILGNVKNPVACRIHVGHHCPAIGWYPLITMVGTSDPAKQAHSEVSESELSSNTQTNDNSPNYQDNVNPDPGNTPPTRPTGEGGETPAENGQTEAQTRAQLESNGVHIAPGLSPTLSPVSKLPNNAIAGAEDLAQDCGPNCNVMITSAARQPGNPTPPGEHGTGKPVFDLNKDPGLDNYIQSNASQRYTDRSGTHYVMPNGDEYLDENYNNTGGTGAHWHVRINADHTGNNSSTVT